MEAGKQAVQRSHLSPVSAGGNSTADGTGRLGCVGFLLARINIVKI
jgi:hypothetical protein